MEANDIVNLVAISPAFNGFLDKSISISRLVGLASALNFLSNKSDFSYFIKSILM